MVYSVGSLNNNFIGLSTDTKPSGVNIGSKFWEYDTSIDYICYDGENWALKNQPIGVFNLLSEDGLYITTQGGKNIITESV